MVDNRNSATCRRRNGGSALVEACIVIALAVLGATIAVPGLTTLLERQRLRGAAAELAADLQWLRSEALARNEALRFSWHPTAAGSCTLIHTGDRADCRCADTGSATCAGDAQALKTSHWLQHDRITVQPNVQSLLFDPAQGTASPTGSIRISDSRGDTVTHIVNIIGRVRSCSPAAAVSGYKAC